MSKTQTKLLGEVASARRGITYSESALRDNPEDGLPYINMKSFLKDGGYNREGLKYYAGFHTTADLTKENDLLIANTDVTRDGDIIGVPALLPNELNDHRVLFSHHVTRLSVSSQLDTRYLYYLLCSDEYRRAMKKYARGTTVLMLDMQGIQRIPVRYPATLEAQKNTAHVLASIDTAIEKTEALIAKYQQIKAGLMHDLFTRGVLPNGQLRPPREQAPELYQETAIGWIPREWDVVLMVSLAEDRAGSTTIGPFGSDLVATDYRPEGVPVVFVRDIKESGFQWNSETYVSERKAQQLNAHSVKAGEVLATKMGLPPCISCVYPSWMPNGVITADMIRLTPDRKKVDPEWLSTAINQDRVVRQVAAITAGVTRPKVTLADFRAIKIAKPEIDEQQRIGSRLSLIQSQIDIELARVAKLQSQKSGLMHDLLTGKVPVTIENRTTTTEAVA